ncbi:hypothetical protein GF339_02470 [candidate division KSB3 bacterium]|uniref:Uncharacterized protein n=1 Tax=candidate division KSB3 bacterium TaxID=2044937 RepID=A0A9D5JSF8_9BACT|nr:hypothetical protein [candidate division KSB3 bacterium]MBD3323418.1 hypothetical protein [candidate division KSB3 bacterium]
MKKSYIHLILTGLILTFFTGIVVLGFLAEAYDSHTFPTFLFIASYDWLHNFYDHNTQGTSSTDPDTDNFNKVITVDSNLFPIMTALFGDYEFPNISGRNAFSWRDDGTYSPSVNDYFNRDIAVAPNFDDSNQVKYQSNPADYRDTKRVIERGAREFMEFAFVVDPGNHNIRRYEFQEAGDFWSFDPYSDIDGPLIEVPDPATYDGGIGQNDCTADTDKSGDYKYGGCDSSHWYLAELEQIWPGDSPWQITSLKASYQNDPVFYLPRWSSPEHETDNDVYTSYAIYTGTPILELEITISEDESASFQNYSITVFGNSSDQKNPVIYMGLNMGFDDTGTRYSGPETAVANGKVAGIEDYIVASADKLDNPTTTYQRDRITFGIPYIDDTFDLDPTEEGIQVKLSLFPEGGGGIAIDWIGPDEDDFAFSVKQDPAAEFGTRWGNLSAFLETVPPESYPGYTTYFQNYSAGLIGYGYRTNTSFAHADNIRFKNPRDIDLYRDFFDETDEGPIYLFVADTMNSRIQVFMNATGEGGRTGATFPIRPARVKAPNDSPNTALKSNELAMRIYTGVNGTSVGFADGRKADWRSYTTVSGSSLSTSRIPANAGRGEFFYPHGVAVDQDPDTKDVYLFVADTFNHRIQVFRDATGVTYHGITSKHFDFEYEEGWGTYPLQTTQTVTNPGPFSFRYPKGVDVVRFANNSSYLYVVDSKDYRVLKYLLVEDAGGGFALISCLAGYGYNGSNFATNLKSTIGHPVHSSIYDINTKVGFWNPQDVATGYSGFLTYTTQDRDHAYQQSITIDGQEYGIKFLDNKMIYVTDYARNDTATNASALNMRVMQFLDNFRGGHAVYLPWATSTVGGFSKGGTIKQSVFNPYSGVYNSAGATENVPGVDGKFTDRPVGIAALTWNTEMLDMRILNTATTPDTVYPNGTTIPNNTLLRLGARTQRFFGLPPSDPTTYTNYTGSEYYIDTRGIERIHVFCYNSSGSYLGYKTVSTTTTPWTFNTNQITNCTSGSYVKMVAEDALFGTSGKTGTMFFKVQ